MTVYTTDRNAFVLREGKRAVKVVAAAGRWVYIGNDDDDEGGLRDQSRWITKKPIAKERGAGLIDSSATPSQRAWEYTKWEATKMALVIAGRPARGEPIINVRWACTCGAHCHQGLAS